VRNSATSDVFKIIAYVVICFVVAALLSPTLYQIGKGFAEAVGNRDTADKVMWLGAKARKAGFDTYFKRCLLLAAVVLIIPLIYSLRLKVDPRKLQKSRWSIYLPEVVRDQSVGQALVKNHSKWLHLFIGFGAAGGIFLIMGTLLFQLGWFEFRADLTGATWGKAIKSAATSATVTSLLEEILFRGAILGIFLRAFKPRTAILLLSLLFASVHFLQPPSGTTLTSPGSPGSGFELLGLIGSRFLQPQPMLFEFTTLLIVGLILGHARFATASLWLPIGLHAGWIFALKVFKKISVKDGDLPEKYDLFIGDVLTEGIIPICALLITWAFLVPIFRSKKTLDPD